MDAALEAPSPEDKEMEDAEEGPGDVSNGVSPQESVLGSPERTCSASMLEGPAAANGNGFMYEHVPAGPEDIQEAAVQEVVVSDTSAGKPIRLCPPSLFAAYERQQAWRHVCGPPLLMGN